MKHFILLFFALQVASLADEIILYPCPNNSKEAWGVHKSNYSVATF
jgi:hypothetical protein